MTEAACVSRETLTPYDHMTDRQKAAAVQISDRATGFMEEYIYETRRTADRLEAGRRGYETYFKSDALSRYVRALMQGQPPEAAYAQALTATREAVEHFNTTVEWQVHIFADTAAPELFWAHQLFIQKDPTK